MFHTLCELELFLYFSSYISQKTLFQKEYSSITSFSQETIQAVPSTSKWLSKPKDRPAANKLNLKAKEKSEKYSFEIDPPDKLRKDTLKDMRKEKLEQLALKEKEAKKEEEKPRPPVQTKKVMLEIFKQYWL